MINPDYFAIATVPFDQSFWNICLWRHLCFLKWIILEIIMHGNVNIKKWSLFSSWIWGKKKKLRIKNKKIRILYTPEILIHRFIHFFKLKSIIFNCGFSIKVTCEKLEDLCIFKIGKMSTFLSKKYLNGAVVNPFWYKGKSLENARIVCSLDQLQKYDYKNLKKPIVEFNEEWIWTVWCCKYVEVKHHRIQCLVTVLKTCSTVLQRSETFQLCEALLNFNFML